MENDFIKSANLQRYLSADKQYHDDKEYISVSGLKKIKVSPAHYKEAEKVEPTEAMIFGSAYHCFILEPERFENEYYIFDDHAICEALIGDGYKSPRATKAYKEWEESEKRIIGDKDIIQKDAFERIRAMKDRLFSHPYAKMLLTNGESEVGIAGSLETTAGVINVKMRPDYIKPEKHIIVDLKTAADASDDGFTRAAADNDYHIQAAFYSDMIELMTGDRLQQTFIFIAQEKIKPYAFNLFECSPQFISQGRYEYELLLQLYKYCLDNNKWPGYQVFCPNRYGLLNLNLPKWAIKDLTYYTY
jgi:hypothetical protein